MAARSTNKVDENKCRWLLKYSEWRSDLAHTSSKKDARYDRNKAELAILTFDFKDKTFL